LIGLLLSLLLVSWQEEFALHACLISCFSHNFLFLAGGVFILSFPLSQQRKQNKKEKAKTKPSLYHEAKKN
jgi:hypothetical protein